MQATRRRTILAGVVGIVGAFLGIAGTGHVYLRQWRRAVGWFALEVGVILVLVATVVETPPTTVMDLPVLVQATLAVILVASVIDALVLAVRGPTTRSDSAPGPIPTDTDVADEVLGEDAGTCPHCGKDVDPDLDFCHWCTERLPEREQAADE